MLCVQFLEIVKKSKFGSSSFLGQEITAFKVNHMLITKAFSVLKIKAKHSLPFGQR